MNVLFVTHYPGFGGANQSGLYLAKLLRDRHCVTPFFVIPFSGVFEKQCAELDIPCYKIRYASWRGPRAGLLGLAFAIMTTFVNLAALPRGILLVRKLKIDVVHANSSLAFYGWLLAKVCGKPIVWHLREFGETDYPMHFYYGEHLAGRIFGSSNTMIAISEKIKEFYSRFVHGKGRLVTVYNGVDVESADIRMGGHVAGIESFRGIKLCTIGSINESKNQIEVVHAMALIKDVVKSSDIHYYLIGGYTKGYEPIFKKAVAELGMGDYVHVLGQHDNVWSLASKMDIGIVPSKSEAFGRVVIELMLCKLPVIASRAGAFPELIEDEVNGFLYDLADASSLAGKICRLIQDKTLATMIGKCARDRAVNFFNAASNAARIFKIYKEVK